MGGIAHASPGGIEPSSTASKAATLSVKLRGQSQKCPTEYIRKIYFFQYNTKPPCGGFVDYNTSIITVRRPNFRAVSRSGNQTSTLNQYRLFIRSSTTKILSPYKEGILIAVPNGKKLVAITPSRT